MNKLNVLLLLLPFFAFAQDEKIDSTQTDQIVLVHPTEVIETVDYLMVKNPIRASLYSAILPGTGQIYNGKWWKAPIVWGILGTGVAFIINYNNQYKEFRGYYLKKLYGYDLGTPALNALSKEQLANIQDDRKRTRDYAIALTALAYILNVVDATVDAHLYGIKKDPDLSVKPVLLQHQDSYDYAVGFGFSLRF
jgi:hypothetical protein